MGSIRKKLKKAMIPYSFAAWNSDRRFDSSTSPIQSAGIFALPSAFDPVRICLGAAVRCSPKAGMPRASGNRSRTRNFDRKGSRSGRL